jgi:anion-transporting  ArsA/GET3 family ATPase
VNADLRSLLAAKEMMIVCGSGGVGKTTTAAALAAVTAAETNTRVLVLTVDPARRLATAMGIADPGSEAVHIPPRLLAKAAGVRKPKGELWAEMLDTKAAWDALISRHAPDASTRDAVLQNRLYQNVTGRFIQSHDYVAMERLYELHASGRYDLVIIDTAPSRNALDFLDAPERMADFFGSRLLRWLTVPYRSRLFTVASKPFYSVADRILGSRFLEDVAEFFLLFQTMERGFVERARQVQRLLVDPRTTFCLVTTLETAPLHESRRFVDELTARSLHLGAVVANKTLPTTLTSAAARAAGAAISTKPLAAALAARYEAPTPQIARVLAEVAARFDDLSMVASRQAERLTELAATSDSIAVAPLLADAIHDLPGLVGLGRTLIG